MGGDRGIVFLWGSFGEEMVEFLPVRFLGGVQDAFYVSTKRCFATVVHGTSRVEFLMSVRVYDLVCNLISRYEGRQGVFAFAMAFGVVELVPLTFRPGFRALE